MDPKVDRNDQAWQDTTTHRTPEEGNTMETIERMIEAAAKEEAEMETKLAAFTAYWSVLDFRVQPRFPVFRAERVFPGKALEWRRGQYVLTPENRVLTPEEIRHQLRGSMFAHKPILSMLAEMREYLEREFRAGARVFGD